MTVVLTYPKQRFPFGSIRVALDLPNAVRWVFFKLAR